MRALKATYIDYKRCWKCCPWTHHILII